jgi:hypothetical protein
MKRLLAIVFSAVLAVLVTPLPAQAAYGNETTYNICQSNRGVYAYNSGYFENRVLLAPCENSRMIEHGFQDTDKFWVSKADICFRFNRGGAGWSGAFRGPLHVEIGESDIYIQAETVSINPYTLDWVCVFK